MRKGEYQGRGVGKPCPGAREWRVFIGGRNHDMDGFGAAVETTKP